MKTVTLTDEQYEYLVCAAENSLRQAKKQVTDAERELVWARHKGNDQAAKFHADMLELAMDTQRKYAGVVAVVKFAGL